jgi:hypothetical protein
MRCFENLSPTSPLATPAKNALTLFKKTFGQKIRKAQSLYIIFAATISKDPT